MQSPTQEIVCDVHAKDTVEIAEDRDRCHRRPREMVILPNEERQSRVGKKSRRSTRRPHRAAFCGLRVWESLTSFPCVTAGEAVATRACSTEDKSSMHEQLKSLAISASGEADMPA
eukprot:311519-Pleurochrysis_carterae.AAC.1